MLKKKLKKKEKKKSKKRETEKYDAKSLKKASRTISIREKKEYLKDNWEKIFITTIIVGALTVASYVTIKTTNNNNDEIIDAVETRDDINNEDNRNAEETYENATKKAQKDTVIGGYIYTKEEIKQLKEHSNNRKSND